MIILAETVEISSPWVPHGISVSTWAPQEKPRKSVVLEVQIWWERVGTWIELPVVITYTYLKS